ncbi:hypothetical protein NDU88_000290 [Pleurodeles waltl]|uniref:Uncharacterized protein n=1 Tax=Pleurodeles waltl TaxID=8319 RepID=A0AAV7KUR6_PLEWA|nr:hypothetical protein NDU88_000290 [Pleurodeles waltl]
MHPNPCWLAPSLRYPYISGSFRQTRLFWSQLTRGAHLSGTCLPAVPLGRAALGSVPVPRAPNSLRGRTLSRPARDKDAHALYLNFERGSKARLALPWHHPDSL